MLQTAGTIESA